VTDRYVVVLDAGSSSARCLVFDQRAQIVATRSTGWSYLPVKDASPYARVFDPQALWTNFCRLITGSLRDAGASPRQVAAITATGQRQGVVFLDANGRELYAGPNLDLRAIFEGGRIDERMRDRVYQTTGHTPSFLMAPAKLLWFQLNHPELYNRIASVLTLADWLAFKLSGVLFSEPSLAGEAGLLDIHHRRWCADLLDDLGLVGNSHVPLVSAGTEVGVLEEEVSRETGVPVGTPVAASGADTQCGLLGMGVTQERQAGIVAGWSVPLQMVTLSPTLSLFDGTWAGCHLMPDRWVLESSAGDAGNSYRWLADTFWGGGANAYAEMEMLAQAVPAGSEGVRAFLGPTRMNMSRLGLRQGGFLFPVPLTFSEMGRGHLVRAALEGIAYAVRANLQQAEGVAGEDAREIAVGGGMIQTQTWVRVLVDVIGRPVKVSPTPRVSALGAYLCAARSLGEFASLEEAAVGIGGALKTVEPDPQGSAEYQDHYQMWLQAAGQLEDMSQ
jgi:autoinducer 2 (AI-2) kinase